MTNKKVSSSSLITLSLLDLPEPTLENILINLSPVELCILSQVCTHFRRRCKTDYLWQKLLTKKWGTLIGRAALQEWSWHIESRKIETPSIEHLHNGSLGSFTGVWPSLYLGSYLKYSGAQSYASLIPDHLVMALYIALETGRFWFPAQAYTSDDVRLLCSDVLLSYKSRTNTFQSRYRYGEWRKIKENVPWDMVRASPVDTLPPETPYLSDCLTDLRPTDHVEVQWRGSKGSPFDWWYGTIGHLVSCNGIENECDCQYNDDMLMVEFKQYAAGSIYRQVVLNKKQVGEQVLRGGGGCYGGIRKLRNEEEIARWMRLLNNL